MADTNLGTTDTLEALSIDFVNNFSNGVRGLLNALQGVRLMPLANGSQIKTYKTTTNKASSRTVGEGETIPYTQISRKVDKKYTLSLTDKLRKGTTFEAVQQSGLVNAVSYTDSQLLAIAQKNAKSDLFDALDSNAATKITAGNFQQAVSQALGKLAGIFEDVDGAGQTVIFVNPDDFYAWLGNQQITMQNEFGLNYVKNFLNAGTVILSSNVTAGHVYATVNNNLKFYYISANGQAGNLFDMQSDSTGLIGVAHKVNESNLTYDTVAVGGWLILPELTTGIVNATISATADSKVATGTH